MKWIIEQNIFLIEEYTILWIIKLKSFNNYFEKSIYLYYDLCFREWGAIRKLLWLDLKNEKEVRYVTRYFSYSWRGGGQTSTTRFREINHSCVDRATDHLGRWWGRGGTCAPSLHHPPHTPALELPSERPLWSVIKCGGQSITIIIRILVRHEALSWYHWRYPAATLQENRL